jgi:hypothetical protein
MLEKIPIVAGDLHDMAFSTESESLDHRDRIAACVIDPTGGNAAEIEIILKDILRRLKRLQLG